MSSVPSELWYKIAQTLWEDQRHEHEHDDKSSILGLVFVNRMLYDIGLSFLYRHLYLDNSSTHSLLSLKRCARTLLDNDIAASCVRHMSFTPSLESVVVDSDPTQEGEQEKETLDGLVARALLRTPNLISLYLRHKTDITAEPALPPALLNISPIRFPFHLQFFATNFPHHEWLAKFMDLQSSLSTVALEAPSGPGPARCLRLPINRDMNCLSISGFRATGEDISHYLQHNPSTRHLILEITHSSEVTVPKHVLSNLESLTLGGYNKSTEAVYMILEQLKGLLPNLKHLKVIHNRPKRKLERHFKNMPAILETFPKLKTVFFTEPIAQMMASIWLLVEPNIRVGLRVFVDVSFHAFGDQPAEDIGDLVLLERESNDVFSCRGVLEQPKLHPDIVPRGSRICIDPDNHYNPEQVLNICMLDGENTKPDRGTLTV